VPTFQYVAKTVSGEEVAGQIQADSEAAVIRALDERRLFPMKVEEKAAAGSGLQQRRIKGRDVGVLYSQLSDLLKADVPVLRALEILTRSTANKRLSGLINSVKEKVAAGEPLAASMAEHPQVFTPLHVAMVRAGERAGFLEEVLANMSEFIERQDELKSKVSGAMVYPMVVVSLGLLVGTGVLIFLVPMFRPMLADVVNKPLPTQVLFALSDILRTLWPLLVVGAVFGVASVWGFVKSSVGRRKWDQWRLKLPLIGRAVQLVAITRFCRVLGMMLKNGVPMLQALTVSKDATGSMVLADAIEAAAENVRAGQTLAAPLGASGLFPLEIIEMISVAEESNQLEKALLQIADTVERRTGRQVDLAVRLLEPMMLVLLAVGIAFFALALILPIFTLAGSLGH
jgi:general secretion pathway protein F